MTTYIQSPTPRTNRVHTMTVRDFTGGLNNRSTQLEDNQASDILNMKFTDDTIMEKRTGVEYYNELKLSAPITYIDTFRPYTEVSGEIVCSDLELYLDGVKMSNVSGRVMGKNFMGKYHFVDGDKIRILGKFPQEASTNIHVFGTAVKENIVLELINPPKDFKPLAKPNKQGVWAYDYINKCTWYEPCEYEIEDTSKGSNVIPEKVAYIEVNESRMYLAGSKEDDDNVFITDVDNAYYTPVYLPIQLPPNSDKIKGLKVFHDSVVVGRENDVHIIYGNTNRTELNFDMFRLKRINAHTGFASQQAVEQVTNYLFYLGNDSNIYSMLTPKTDVDMLITTMLNNTIDVNKTPISAPKGSLANANSVYHEDEWYIVLHDKILIYSYRHRAWSMYAFQACEVSHIAVLNNKLVMGTQDGRLVKFSDASYSDLGYPYESYWKSKNFDMDAPIYEKFFRDFFIVANTYISSPTTIRLVFEIDYTDTQNNFNVSSKIAIWGLARFGDRFFTRAINASEPFLVGQRGRSVRITFRNGYFISGSIPDHATLLYVTNTVEGMLYYVEDEDAYYAYEKFTWVKKGTDELYQPMKVFEVNGQFEYRGVR